MTPPDSQRPNQPAAAGGTQADEAANQPMRELILDSIGGWRGFADSALPAAVFVIANMIGGLTPAIWAGAICAGIIFAIRLIRRESVQQAIGGLFGVGICIFIANQTGEARGFFIFGIVRSGLIAAVLVGSILLRWPLIGVIWNFLFRLPPGWRDDRRTMRAFVWLTAAWALGYALKFAAEGYLYLVDSPTGLGAVRIVLGYPLSIGLLLLTLVVARTFRTTDSAQPSDATSSSQEEPTAEAPAPGAAQSADLDPSASLAAANATDAALPSEPLPSVSDTAARGEDPDQGQRGF